MSLIDAVAVLGALAWIPPIFVGLRSVLARPQVRVITQQQVEIGFTTYGPIANVRIAFASARKEVIVSDIQMELKHEAGDIQIFSWQSIVQPIARLNTPAGMAFSEKEQSVLAVKVNTKEIEERHIRFQDPSYHKGKRDLVERLVKKLTFIGKSGDPNLQSILGSEEVSDLTSYTKQAFTWKSGNYTLTFKLRSPERVDLKDYRYEFVLTPIDIELLDKNKSLIDAAYADELLQGTSGYVSKALSWNWRYPLLSLKT